MSSRRSLLGIATMHVPVDLVMAIGKAALKFVGADLVIDIVEIVVAAWNDWRKSPEERLEELEALVGADDKATNRIADQVAAVRIFSVNMHGMPRTPTIRRTRSVRRSRTPLVSTTCMEMSGGGAWTGMMPITTSSRRRVTRGGLRRPRTG
jgi:hypothetical protein